MFWGGHKFRPHLVFVALRAISGHTMRAKPFPRRARKVAACMLEELEQQETIQEQLVVPRLEIAPPAPVLVENDQRQRRRMVIALVMLLVALGLVLIKDRDFWFPAPEAADSEVIDDSTPVAAEETARQYDGLPRVAHGQEKAPSASAGRQSH